MKKTIIRGLLVPETIAGVVIIAACSYLLGRVENMPKASALLPELVLWFGMILASVMIFTEVKKSFKSEESNVFFVDVNRFLIAAVLSCIYVPAVHFIGFYSATALFVPLTAWMFGYRNKRVIASVSVIFIASLFVIFSLIMGKELPSEFFLG
ncbi:MAG: tripartite tricarboxylate transporter TctB family protein [Oceanospirillaceae bacterium]|nr:tripartite tricarboxylate transporter TctB family protein [Oceanospirillaceae bacterium]